MRSSDLPPWLQVIPGTAVAVLIAPHGGRRPAQSELEITAPRKANDLFTAEITAELARRTGAAALINPSEDRNALDLNRLSHVRRKAGWMLDWLLAEARRQIDQRGAAVFFFIHGWNAIQPSCDVGIGARLDDDRFVAVKEGQPTVPRTFLRHLFRFAERCRAAGIEVTFGDRYPAAGRDNLLQCLSPRFAADADPRVAALAALAAAGTLCAVQLELAVPLRWPGAARERLLDCATALVADAAVSTGGDTRHARSRQRAEPALPARLALDLHDGVRGCGLFAALERAPTGRRQARLLLCLGDGHLVLFTGEDGQRREHELACMGLRFEVEGEESARFEYRGAGLRFPRSDPFLDLEAGLAEAELVDLEAELEWRRTPVVGAGGLDGRHTALGRLEGRIRADGVRLGIGGPALLQTGLAAGGGDWRERHHVRVALADGRFLSIESHRSDEERVEGAILSQGRAEALLSGRSALRLGTDGLTPEAWRLDVVSRSGPLRVLGQVTSAIPVVRPSKDGKVLTYFGLARFGLGPAIGFGTFEASRRLPDLRVPPVAPARVEREEDKT